MKYFEYKVLRCELNQPHITENQLNLHANVEWELVAVVINANILIYYLKKKKEKLVIKTQ